MALPDICLARSGDGSGSYAGGAGPGGAASGQAGGSGTQDSGLPFIKLTTAMHKTIQFGLYETLCGKEPVDLTDAGSVYFVAKEIVNSPRAYISKQMTIIDPPADGRVSVELLPEDLPFAGIWPAAVVVLNADDELVEEYRLFLYVERSITDSRVCNRPLTIPEVRMTLRDVCPGYNTLLDDLEFSDTEIAFAISKPVDEWNETSPNLPQYSYTPATFPWRDSWLRATCAHLLNTAAYHYLRNDIKVAAGGLDIDDKAKHAGYRQIAQQLRQEWLAWIIRKKRELNMGLCFGGIGSVSFGGKPYSYRR